MSELPLKYIEALKAEEQADRLRYNANPEPARAIRLYERAITLLRNIGDDVGRSTEINELRGKINKAKIEQRAKDAENEGDRHLSHLNLEEAIRSYRKAVDIIRSSHTSWRHLQVTRIEGIIKPVEIAISAIKLEEDGDGRRRNNRPEEAIRRYERAIDKLKGLDYHNREPFIKSMRRKISETKTEIIIKKARALEKDADKYMNSTYINFEARIKDYEKVIQVFGELDFSRRATYSKPIRGKIQSLQMGIIKRRADEYEKRGDAQPNHYNQNNTMAHYKKAIEIWKASRHNDRDSHVRRIKEKIIQVFVKLEKRHAEKFAMTRPETKLSLIADTEKLIRESQDVVRYESKNLEKLKAMAQALIKIRKAEDLEKQGDRRAEYSTDEATKKYKETLALRKEADDLRKEHKGAFKETEKSIEWDQYHKIRNLKQTIIDINVHKPGFLERTKKWAGAQIADYSAAGRMMFHFAWPNPGEDLYFKNQSWGNWVKSRKEIRETTILMMRHKCEEIRQKCIMSTISQRGTYSYNESPGKYDSEEDKYLVLEGLPMLLTFNGVSLFSTGHYFYDANKKTIIMTPTKNLLYDTMDANPRYTKGDAPIRAARFVGQYYATVGPDPVARLVDLHKAIKRSDPLHKIIDKVMRLPFPDPNKPARFQEFNVTIEFDSPPITFKLEKVKAKDRDEYEYKVLPHPTGGWPF